MSVRLKHPRGTPIVATYSLVRLTGLERTFVRENLSGFILISIEKLKINWV